MRAASDKQPSTACFDPFGEPVADGIAGTCASSGADRTAVRIGAAVFWTLVLAIMAGRIYAGDLPSAHTVVAFVSQAVVLR